VAADAPKRHPEQMGQVLALPARGEVFTDPRGDGRTLRVSWHESDAVVVLSLWHGNRCTSSFRVSAEDLPDLVRALTVGPLTGR
jgi:hypothetical protein